MGELKKLFLLVLFVIMLIPILLLGQCSYEAYKINKESVKVAHSKEAKNLYRKVLREYDQNAFTEKGIIKSYKIDGDSISHNPMGGVEVDLIINDNKKLDFSPHIDKTDGKLEIGSLTYSAELDRLFTVHSKDIKILLENLLRKLDHEALTENGKIRTYSIEDKSIAGGASGAPDEFSVIKLNLIVNNDVNLKIKMKIKNISEDIEKEKYTVANYSLSENLSNLLKGGSRRAK
ncbi:DUF1310 family protein [Listeria valentina]|uniref:DUF1310 family protein n=1 Tax=Listeria valentina TaxID=2705293 RepID=UPI001431B734|nr:DUF1310 family protein [Listeria valentina]